jgi:HSP20 family protein
MAEMKKTDQNQQPNQSVAVQRGDGGQGQTQQGQGQQGRALQRQSDLSRNPFALMREMLRDPFGSMMPMASDLSAAFEVRETDDAFVFKADVPGIKREDIEINLHGHRLTISGKRDQEVEDRSNDRYYTYERSYGSFQRVFTLPEQVDLDQIRSNLQDGVLSVVVPKKAGPQPRKIEIGSGSKS